MDAVQMKTITATAVRLTGRDAASAAAPRCSAMTSGGTSFTTAQMLSGTITTSSTYPNTGMKSGTRSMGDKAYPAAQSASAFAYQGTRGSRAARYSAWASRLTVRAQSLSVLAIRSILAANGTLCGS